MRSDFIDRARHARQRLGQLKANTAAIGEYLTAVRGLPADIRLVGLGQALAILLSRSDVEKKDKDGFRHLYDHVQSWLVAERKIYELQKEKPTLLDAIIAGDDSSYRRATAEADAYLAVLKRLAEALLAPLQAQKDTAAETAA
jgi:CRISPR type III-B/RAMP module-associated protein Cmr5